MLFKNHLMPVGGGGGYHHPLGRCEDIEGVLSVRKKISRWGRVCMWEAK